MPAGELYINEKDAYKTWGVSLEDGAMDSLMSPLSMKQDIVNESRLEHGKRHINIRPKVDEREIALPMHLSARNKSEYLIRLAAFRKVLESGEEIVIRTSHETGVCYRCIYRSCTPFSAFLGGLAKFSLKLTEPDPTNRSIS